MSGAAHRVENFTAMKKRPTKPSSSANRGEGSVLKCVCVDNKKVPNPFSIFPL